MNGQREPGPNFDLIEYPSPEEAVEIAATHPMADGGTIEIRPLWGNCAPSPRDEASCPCTGSPRRRLGAPRPTELLTVVHQLTLLQIDPTAAVAPSADLVAWSRLGSASRVGTGSSGARSTCNRPVFGAA
jgi:hypothetical protein